jgi:L-fuconolactonase
MWARRDGRAAQTVPSPDAKDVFMALTIDSQIHIWVPETSDRPWPPGGREWGANHRPAISAEQARTEMAEAGVDRAVLVPPGFHGIWNDYAIASAEKYPDSFRVMGRVSLLEEDEANLVSLVENPYVAGLRFLFVSPVEGRLSEGVGEWIWPIAQRLDVPIMLIAPGEAHEIGKLAQRYPSLRLAVDHLGMSGQNKDAAAAGEIAAVLELAELPNVSLKVSNAPYFSMEDYPYPTVMGYVEQLISAFGPERTFWGSDLSSLRGTYPDLTRLFREETPFLTLDERDQVMGESLSRWLDWP